MSVERNQQHCLYLLHSHTVWVITICLYATLRKVNQVVIILAFVWEIPVSNLHLNRPG